MVHSCTKVEHDAHLQNLMWVACKYGLVLNQQKTYVKAPAINFLSCHYDAHGVYLDLDKVYAIHAITAPTNITKLWEVLGMVMYLSPFIPGLSILTAPLHELLKKDTNFTWNCTYDATFQHVKDVVISDTTLWYFDPSLPMTIQVDASQVGLGAVLLQNNKPIAFISKSLTTSECCYANIEQEMLTVIFGAERFITYIYSRSFTMKSDHKPLESISQKNLADMPAQLQHMLLHLQGYDYTIHYHPGKKWPCLTPSLASVHILAPTSHWILPFTMLACPQSRRKHSTSLCE